MVKWRTKTRTALVYIRRILDMPVTAPNISIRTFSLWPGHKKKIPYMAGQRHRPAFRRSTQQAPASSPRQPVAVTLAPLADYHLKTRLYFRVFDGEARETYRVAMSLPVVMNKRRFPLFFAFSRGTVLTAPLSTHSFSSSQVLIV